LSRSSLERMSKKRKSPESTKMSKSTSTITLTFGDQAENHAGMQKIGSKARSGFTREDLTKAQTLFEKMKCACEMHDLTVALPESKRNEVQNEAYLLVIRKGVQALLHEDNKIEEKEAPVDRLWTEQSSLDLDTKAFMYGRVVNKKARHNLCFADTAQEPDYDSGKGRIVTFDSIPLTNTIRKKLERFLGEKASGLVAEGNYYYDVKKCGIGWHGDSERKRVVGVRLGSKMPLHFNWFQNSKALGETVKISLGDGDIYVMSEKVVGSDWKLRKIYTLRHAAGAAKFLKL